jgi:hypothetical protein
MLFSFTRFSRTYLKRGVYSSSNLPIHGKQLKYRLYHYPKQLKKLGLDVNRCNICRQGKVWNNKPLVLELHHKNGDSNDNRVSNLQMLCPHCHTQTHNYKRRKS